jgi:hypothetical protein
MASILHGTALSELVSEMDECTGFLVLSSVLSDPFKVIKTGPGQEIEGDPMKPLEAELAKYRYVQIPQVQTFTGKSDDRPQNVVELNALYNRRCYWLRNIRLHSTL